MKSHLRLLLLLISISAFGPPFCPEPGPSILEAYQFKPLVPPSNMVTVGAVLAIENEQIEGLQEKYTVSCGPRASLGVDFIPSSSATVGQSFRDQKSSSWNLDAGMMDQLKGHFDASKINNIHVQITNARILSLSDADVLENLRNRSDQCRKAIQMRLSQNYPLTMVNAALIADLTYTVDWKESKTYDKKARLVEMQRISASLGGGQSRIGLSKMESRGLALGIRTDAFLLALSVPEMDAKSVEVVERAAKEKREGMHAVRADSEHPDSQYILPAGNNYVAPEFIFDE